MDTDVEASRNNCTFKELVTSARIQRWKELKVEGKQTKHRATVLRGSEGQTDQISRV